MIVGVDPDPANKDRIAGWAKRLLGGAASLWRGRRVCELHDGREGEDRIRATYRDNYDRLAKIKAKYDPENFFRVNQNIKPEKGSYVLAL